MDLVDTNALVASESTRALLEFAQGHYEGKEEAVLSLLSTILFAPDEPHTAIPVHQKRYIRSLRGGIAQATTDLLQYMVDYMPSHGDPVEDHLRSSTRRLLINLSKDSGCLSARLELDDFDLDLSATPVTGGGCSDIFQVDYKGQIVCVKKLRLYIDGRNKRELRRELCREAMIARQFHHRHLLKLLGISSRSENSICLITPWIEPGNLFNYYAKVPNPHPPVMLLRQVIDALVYLHTEHFIHGDIKADNVLVSNSGHAFLADYGFTAFGDATGGIQSNNGGSMRWMAPELLQPAAFNRENSVRTEKTDIYAFGMLILEAFTLRYPFSRYERAIDVMLAVLNKQRPQRPSPDECPCGTPPPYIWDIATRCWNGADTLRPTTIEVQNVLSQ